MTDPLHRHQEWLKFLKMIDRKTPNTKELHLVADNYATHKHPEVKAWLAKHPRFVRTDRVGNSYGQILS